MIKDSQNPSSADFKTALDSLDVLLDFYLVKKAPTLPENIKEILVTFSPYISIIVLIASVPGLLALMGLSTFLTPAYILAGPRFTFGAILSICFFAITMYLEAKAIPGLFKRQASAWKLIYYVALLNCLNALIHFQIGNLIVGGVISLYFIYQIKSYYKN